MENKKVLYFISTERRIANNNKVPSIDVIKLFVWNNQVQKDQIIINDYKIEVTSSLHNTTLDKYAKYLKDNRFEECAYERYAEFINTIRITLTALS